MGMDINQLRCSVPELKNQRDVIDLIGLPVACSFAGQVRARRVQSSRDVTNARGKLSDI